MKKLLDFFTGFFDFVKELIKMQREKSRYEDAKWRTRIEVEKTHRRNELVDSVDKLRDNKVSNIR